MNALPALWFSPASCRPVVLRSIAPDDADGFAEFVRGLSPLSRQRRFHTGLAELPASWLHQMVRPPATDFALVAVALRDAQPRIVAEARYGVDPRAGTAQREFALAVADDWQHQGLGRELLVRLAAHAAGHGVRRLVGDVLRDNLPMQRLAQGLGYAPRKHPEEARLLQLVRELSPAPQALEPSSDTPRTAPASPRPALPALAPR